MSVAETKEMKRKVIVGSALGPGPNTARHRTAARLRLLLNVKGLVSGSSRCAGKKQKGNCSVQLNNLFSPLLHLYKRACTEKTTCYGNEGDPLLQLGTGLLHDS